MLLASLVSACRVWISNAASVLPRWNPAPSPNIPTSLGTTRQIEDYRAGYPQLSALLSSYDGFVVCRSFRRMRARLLLQKQDRLCVLEQKLDRIDKDETSPLFLGKLRIDRNEARTSLLSQIDEHLADYDAFMERTRNVMNTDPAIPRDIQSIKNWLEGTNHVSRAETAFLDEAQGELICLAPSLDSATKQIETWVEDNFIRYYPKFREVITQGVSRNEEVYIYPGPLIKYLAKGVLLLLISILLMTPIIICNAILTLSGRMGVIILSTIIYLIVVSVLANSKTTELIVAGATFATILTVFVASPS